MSYVERAWSSHGRSRVSAAAAILVVGAAVLGFVATRLSATSHDHVAMPTVTVGAPPLPSAPGPAGSPAPVVPDRLPFDQQTGLTAADGVVPAGVTVFDERYPAVTKLNPALVVALRRAATDAGRAGITFYVDSGWRSDSYQERLFREAIVKYGSEAEAARWVATPDVSAHVSGDAVDIGRSNATAWLSSHGARYGLCQIYRNEPWHYELRPDAAAHGCPAMYADAAHDPRMQP